MEKVHIIIVMEINLQEVLKIIILKEKENTSITMVINILVIIKMIRKKELEYIITAMDGDLKVNLKKGKKVAQG